MRKSNDSDRDSKREILAPYLDERLCFEGVLISTITPNISNGHTYGLVFASIYAPHQDIELDHVVIQMDVGGYKRAGLNLYSRYQFTAKVDVYYKTGLIQGMTAKRRHYMLIDMNIAKIKRIHTSKMKQPTCYVANRINNISKFSNKTNLTKKKLFDKIMNMPNDGAVECFIDKNIKASRVKRMARYEIVNALYD